MSNVATSISIDKEEDHHDADEEDDDDDTRLHEREDDDYSSQASEGNPLLHSDYFETTEKFWFRSETFVRNHRKTLAKALEIKKIFRKGQ